jgi:hypothetical protein
MSKSIFYDGDFQRVTGILRPPEAVRAVLTYWELFQPDDIQQWTEPVINSLGVSQIMWVVKAAKVEGLVYKKDVSRFKGRAVVRDFNVHDDKSGLDFEWGVRGVPLKRNGVLKIYSSNLT